MASNSSQFPGLFTKRGVAVITTGQSSVTVTDPAVTAPSVILGMSQNTTYYVASIVPSNGSFIIRVNTNVAGNTTVVWAF